MKKVVYVSGVIAVILVAGYLLWLRQGRSLSSEFVPTAEALIQNPLSRSAFVAINPRPGENLIQGQKMCLSILGEGLLKSGEKFKEFSDFLEFNTFLYINNRPLSPVESGIPAMPGGNGSGPETGIVYLCFVPDLEKGIHMAEVTTKNSSGTEFSYKWAFYVQ